MVRIMEILVALNAVGGIATFLGIRMATRKTRRAVQHGLEKVGIDISAEEDDDEVQPAGVVQGPQSEEHRGEEHRSRKGNFWSSVRRIT